MIDHDKISKLNIFEDLPSLDAETIGYLLAKAFNYVHNHDCKLVTHSHDYTIYDVEKISDEILKRANK